VLQELEANAGCTSLELRSRLEKLGAILNREDRTSLSLRPVI